MRRLLGVAVAVAAFATGCGGDHPASAPTTSASPSTALPAGSMAPVADNYAPHIDPAVFTSVVDNPYFPLRPGTRWEYKSRTADGVETTLVEVTTKTKTLMGVVCVEVRDTVRLDGQVKEDTLDWYAQSRDGTVWYFGEDTKEYENGKVSSTKGTWSAGVDGAQPGILMPGHPQIGDRYRQEFYRGDAEDIAEVLSLTANATVPAGSYADMVQTKETTPLEAALVEHKFYARGVGPVLTVDVVGGGVRDELISITR